MSENCNHDCSNCASKCENEKKDFRLPQNANSNVKKVIGVVSGKGGVGKSFVTSTLALASQLHGYKTAILDADITGPSIPKGFGIHGRALGNDEGILPAETKLGIKIMSINLLLEKEDAPVIWRGPVISGVINQFWQEVQWGDVDYMFVDMPPGTGDVPLTVFQSLPIDGIIIVTSPQELVSMIVEKAVNMAALMNIPVLGIVENYSYVECPDCGKKINVFGESHLEETAGRYSLDILARIPLDPKLAAACDKGAAELTDTHVLDRAAEIIEEKTK